MNIPEPLLKTIFAQVEKEYPHESCGMIMSPVASPDELARLRPCQNAQNKYHGLDPENFPRTSKTAYFIDPKELLAIQRELRENRETIRIIYHSHIDAESYFSDEDKRIALSEGQPAYPGVDYLVVSVYGGRIKDYHLYHWDAERKDFVI